MATKPKEVDWTGLNSLKSELVAWLDARKLVDPNDDELTIALKLQVDPRKHGPVVSAVAQALFHVENFVAASRRAVGENIIPKRAQLSEDDRKLLTLMTDDSVEREADSTIRALEPKLDHIERLLERIMVVHEERAKAMRSTPDNDYLEYWHTLAAARIYRIQHDLSHLKRAFYFMSPAMRREAITLSGARRFERRVRRILKNVGYP